MEKQKCSYELYFSILNIKKYIIILLKQMFIIIYAMDLCDVFHNAQLSLPILVGTK
jgi:hypothetical protein